MDRNKLKQLRHLAAEHRSTKVTTEFGNLPESIPVLASFVSSAEPEELEDVYGVLIDECIRAGRFDLELRFRKDLVQRFPNDPIPLCSLASSLASDPSTQAEAMESARAAVNLAKQTDSYVRYALTTQLRVAMQLDNYPEVNSMLTALVEDSANARDEDYVFESDFVDALDMNKVSGRLLQRYLEVAGSR